MHAMESILAMVFIIFKYLNVTEANYNIHLIKINAIYL